MKTVIEMAREAGFDPHDMSADFTCNLKDIEAFAELVRADEREKQAEAFQQILAAVRNDTRADEREAIEDEWSMCVQSDLEHGVKSLNEQAAKDWFKNYPEIAKFGAWLAARSNT